MNNMFLKTKKSIINQKKKYLFFTILSLIGIISGFLFIYFISKTDKLLVHDEINLFLNSVKDNNLNYGTTLLNSIVSNLLYFIFIWILGISIIGIPIILFLIFLKSFIFGFSISSIINVLGIKGILVALFYQLPHNLVLLVLFVLISFYAVNFSIKLFRMLFFKENINLSFYFKKYNLILFICILISIGCSLIEVFLVPYLINLFL